MATRGGLDTLADTPAEAAYHLVAAKGCCDPPKAPRGNRQLSADIANLERQKVALEGELEAISGRLCSLPTLLELGSETKFLNSLVVQLEQENEQARAVGLANLETLAAELCRVEQDRTEVSARTVEVSAVYREEIEINHGLKAEIDALIQRVRLLHDRNNELVRLFL